MGHNKGKFQGDSKRMKQLFLSFAPPEKWRDPKQTKKLDDEEWQKLRKKILEKDNFTCAYCGYKSDKYQIVHHIDVNKWNSLNFWNLIDLTVEQHERIVHSKINKGDWMGGIKVLMEALHWTEKNLPRHIQQHLKKK